MDTIALILVLIGALNWGLVGFFGYDLVASLFGGADTTLARLIYSAVGLAGLWGLTWLFRENRITARHHHKE